MKYVLIILIAFLTTNISGQDNDLTNQFRQAILNNDEAKQKKLAVQLKADYSFALYEYYRLSFNNLPLHSVLVTNANDDSFPLRILQLTEGLRQDVEVVSLSFLENESYLKRINKKYGFNLKAGDKTKQMKLILASKKNVFVSTTVSSKYWGNTDHFLIGLAIGRNVNDSLKR